MKKIIAVLTIISVTAAVVLFPNIYYSKADEGIKDYHKQDTYNLNKVDNIDLQKKLDILTDENSVYIDKTINDITENDGNTIVEIINQIGDILEVDVNGTEMVKTAIENGVRSIQVINSSSYNVYSVDLRIIQAYSDKLDLTILFDANEKKILYAEVLYLLEDKIDVIEEEDPKILENIEEYYGEFTNWNLECFGYGEVLNVGSQQEINYILRKVGLQTEEDYMREVQNYDYEQEN